MKKNLLFAISVFMIVALVAGCAPKATEVPTEVPAQPTTPPAQPTTPPAQPTTPPVQPTAAAPAVAPEVTIAISADPSDLSPFVGMSMGRIAVLKTIYEYLLETDAMGAAAVPMIAKSVEKTGDKTYTVTIFDYIYDSAGNHITAADVAWSFNTGMAAGNLRPLGDIESVKATGDYTVEFVFKREFGVGELDKVLTECPIVSQKAYESSADEFATKPVTTGPYVLTEYIPGSRLVFERRDDYWQNDPQYRTLFSQANVQKIIFQVITEPAQHAIALETGSADISAGVTGDDVARFESDPNFTVFKFRDNLTWLLAFNGSEGNPFTKKELRQAVAYAIDTAAMCNAVAPGACEPVHTIGNANFGGYLTKWDNEPYYEYDLTKAEELFAAAGYKPGDLTIKLLAQNDARNALMAQVIQAQLGDLGINVEISLVETPVFNQQKYDPAAFDLLIDAAAGGDFIFSPWLLIYDQNRNKGTTGTFFKDDELQALLMTASSLDGFNAENVDAFQQYQKEQLYAYGMISFYNNVVAVKGITKVVRDTRGQIIPGACEYAPDFK
ncbi:MAG: ABC transporter substrate-binding protein [Anaerolineae bacterium]|nr:ABC transporter substrate-binding protein [Anaerolineae bacterium]